MVIYTKKICTEIIQNKIKKSKHNLKIKQKRQQKEGKGTEELMSGGKFCVKMETRNLSISVIM